MCIEMAPVLKCTNPLDGFNGFSRLQMRTTLDVRWPTPSLTLEPQHFNTYPEQLVLATLEYTGISCTPAKGIPVTTYSLQLIYCGSSVLSCDPRNKSHGQVGFSRLRDPVTLRHGQSSSRAGQYLQYPMLKIPAYFVDFFF